MDTNAAACATSREVLERILAGYWTRTRDYYRFILTRWCLDW